MLFRTLTIFTFTLLLLLPAGARAEDEIVSPADLHKQIQAASQTRQANLSKIQKLFSAEPMRKALSTARIDVAKIEKGLPLLTDVELARLASQADKIQSDFAAGALSNQEITYIIIALATAVLILIIVAAR